MRQDLILAPMGALAALTFAVLLMIPFRRFQAGFAGKVTRQDFVYGESANVPGVTSLPNRNYMNLLEAPMLFYVICLMHYVTNRVGVAALVMAWIYVALRVLHSGIHLTYNKVDHRLTAFATSNLVLLALWVEFFVA
jgi:hypothetical protein